MMMCIGRPLLPLLGALLLACPGPATGADQDAAADATADASGPLDTLLHLAVGEVEEVAADATGVLRAELATPNGDEVFLVMLQSRALGTNIVRAFTATSTAAAARLIQPERLAPARRPASSPRQLFARQGCLSAGGRVDVATVVRELDGWPVPRGVFPLPPLPGPPPSQGDTIQFDIDSNAGVVTISASVLMVTTSLVVALDKTTDPNLTLDATLLSEVTAGFEDIVLPRERLFFGTESDVNADGHVTVLFSPLVYETGATAYVNPYDLITDPAARPAGVAANDQEMLYVTPPQLLPPHMGTARGITETLAHEMQHAIYFYRKYQLNDQVDGAESAYVTEGLSALAQDLTGYQAGNFFVAMAGLNEIDNVSVNDLAAYLGGYLGARDGSLRGGGYLLLRYLYDQAGGDSVNPDGSFDRATSPGIDWLRALVDAPELGVANLERAAGMSFAALAADWYTAMLVDDRVDGLGVPLNTDPRWNYLPTVEDPLTGRIRGTSSFESFGGMVTKTGPLIRELADADGQIREGGAEYLRVTAAGSPVTILEISADPAQVDPALRIFRVE